MTTLERLEGMVPVIPIPFGEDESPVALPRSFPYNWNPAGPAVGADLCGRLHEACPNFRCVKLVVGLP